MMIRRSLFTIVMIGLMLPAALAQHRGGGNRQGGGYGNDPYRGGRDGRDFYDQDRDGIDDRFQERYRQGRLRKAISARIPDLRLALALPEGEEIVLVSKPGEIPKLADPKRSEFKEAGIPAPPVQYSIEDDRNLTIFYTWSAFGGQLVRWYMFEEPGGRFRLEGKRLGLGLGRCTEIGGSPLPESIQWPRETPAP